MAAGKADHERELFLLQQEDAWERTARVLAKIHNVNCTKADELREDDDFNAWLCVPEPADGIRREG